MNACAEPPRREREKAAPRADVEEALVSEIRDVEELDEGFFGFGDALFVDLGEKRLPVSAECEARAGRGLFSESGGSRP